MKYDPQPGTAPHRIIQWLRTQPAGELFPAAVIADAIDNRADCVQGQLAAAVKAGAIECEKRDGRNYWGLADKSQPQWFASCCTVTHQRVAVGVLPCGGLLIDIDGQRIGIAVAQAKKIAASIAVRVKDNAAEDDES